MVVTEIGMDTENGMELIVISDSQIKLMLSVSDMAPYSGTAGEIVREILRDAQRLPGIGRLDGRVFVEYYPSRGEAASSSSRGSAPFGPPASDASFRQSRSRAVFRPERTRCSFPSTTDTNGRNRLF